MDDVRVNKLCANELCVDGEPVLVGDGNVCTSDDIVNGTVVHAPIKDCCVTDADCAQWLPAPCSEATCLKESDDAPAGVCVYEQLANCCTKDADCPVRECETATCVATDADQGVFERTDAGHFRKLDTESDALSVPGQCQYEEREDCCTTSADCPVGAPNTTPICDKGCECIYVPSTEFECKVDADCAANTAETERCRAKRDKKGRGCFDNVCDRGWCACTQDCERDADGDGASCGEDCDDRDASVGAPVYCAWGNATEIDADGDGFVKCGTPVDAECLPADATCPNGLPPLDPSSIGTSSAHQDARFVQFDCDCCDMNADGLDEPLFCGRDANNNDCFAPSESEESSQCGDEQCVLQPVEDVVDDDVGEECKYEKNRRTGKTERVCEPKQAPKKRTHRVKSNAERDEQCAQHNNSTDFSFVPLNKRSGPCDECDGVEGALAKTADATCPKTLERVNGDESTFSPICPVDSTMAGTTFAACCQDLLSVERFANGVPDVGTPERERVVAMVNCCLAAGCEAGQPCSVEPDECGDCFVGEEPDDAPAVEFPLECAQCGCEDTGDAICPEGVVECVVDRDWDGYYNCEDVTTICVAELPESEQSEWRRRKAAEDDADIWVCQQEIGGTWPVTSLGAALGMNQGANLTDPSDRDHTFCDCDDKNKHAFAQIVCVRDADEDGFPAADNPYFVVAEDGTGAQCAGLQTEGICANYCPKGYARPSSFDTPECAAGALHKRALATEQLARVAAKHGFHDTLAKRSAHYYHKDDDDDKHSDSHKQVPKRIDEELSFSCRNALLDACDCCDEDHLVNPDSLLGSTTPNACGTHDHNCNGQLDTYTACPESLGSAAAAMFPDRENWYTVGPALPTNGLRPDGIFSIFTNGATQPFQYDNVNRTFATSLMPQAVCSPPVNGECGTAQLQPGIMLEAIDNNRKRQANAQAPSCETFKSFTRDDLVDDSMHDERIPALVAGDCFSFGEACVEAQDTCSVDCEVCTLLWQ